MNELLLIVSLLISFGALLAFARIFGKNGIFAFVAIATVLANIEVVIVVKAFGMTQTLGNILFASTFLATDILSECYGKKDANRAVLIGILSEVAFAVISRLWLFYTPENPEIFTSLSAVFSQTPRIIAASLFAFAVSQLLDVRLYHFIWKKTGESKRFLWLRNNAATLASQLVNTVLFNFAAFYGVFDIKTLVFVTASGYVIFIFTSLLDTPFLYLARRMKKAE